MGGSSAVLGTSLLLLAVFNTERRALESSPGPVLSSTRTTTSLEAVRSSRTTAATTTEEAQGRSSLPPTSSRTSSRMSSRKSVSASTTQAASTPPETVQHEEYTVVRLLKHPQFNAGRLSNDIALLYTDRDINLNKANVNTACLPSCRDQ